MGRKRPPKEKKQLKERWEIEELVFDKKTLLTLSRIMKKGIFETLDYVISTGKEANVYRATKGGGKFLAVKIYKVETARFFRRDSYIDGDPRFSGIKFDDYSLSCAFASKEFKNLMIAERAHVSAPKPVFHEKNVVVMSFLGENGLPYPKIKDAKDIIDEGDFWKIINDIKALAANGLVHGDLSEFNILVSKDRPYIIDFSQGVLASHPHARELLKRDIMNVISFFEKTIKISVDRDLIINEILSYIG